jgi:hypothetical protein
MIPSFFIHSELNLLLIDYHFIPHLNYDIIEYCFVKYFHNDHRLFNFQLFESLNYHFEFIMNEFLNLKEKYVLVN